MCLGSTSYKFLIEIDTNIMLILEHVHTMFTFVGNILGLDNCLGLDDCLVPLAYFTFTLSSVCLVYYHK